MFDWVLNTLLELSTVFCNPLSDDLTGLFSYFWFSIGVASFFIASFNFWFGKCTWQGILRFFVAFLLLVVTLIKSLSATCKELLFLSVVLGDFYSLTGESWRSSSYSESFSDWTACRCVKQPLITYQILRI